MSFSEQKKINEINKKFQDADAYTILEYFIERYKEKIVFSSSLGAEDQVLTEMIVRIDKKTKIFTLDTGRLFGETYELIEKTNARYGINISVYFPDRQEVEDMVNKKGVNLFYESIENRKLCCKVRKIGPMTRALKGVDIWITGLRREQSVTRDNLNVAKWDENYKLIKLNPLINWTENEVWNYIREKNIPYNKLHDLGYLSIGCAPCTRTVKKGEDVRAGRWWWEMPEHKECGLHVKK